MGLAGVGVGISAAGLAANVGGKIAGGLGSSSAASTAGGQEAGAIGQGLDFAQQTWADTQGQFQPYIGTGTNALGSLAQVYGLPAPPGSTVPAGSALDAYSKFQQTPFYQFPLTQGIDAMNRSGAARGLTLSGGQMNALQKYGADYASGNFSNYIAGLSQLANLGATSTNQLGTLGAGYAGTVLGGTTNQGVARAAGTVGAQNGVNNALSGLGPLGQGASDLVKQIGALNSSSSYAPGTSGGFNNGADLVNSDGSVVVPPIPPS